MLIPFVTICFTIVVQGFILFLFVLQETRNKKNITKLKIFTDSLCLIFFLILFYVSFEITAEAFIKNHNISKKIILENKSTSKISFEHKEIKYIEIISNFLMFRPVIIKKYNSDFDIFHG